MRLQVRERIRRRYQPDQFQREITYMAQVGQFALALAFVVTIYSIIASLIGIRLKNDKLIASGKHAAIGTFVCITVAIGSLGYLFAVSDFSVSYVAQHSNRDLPTYFKIASI